MALTKIDEYEVMYSANQFVPRIWLKGGGRPIGQLIFNPQRINIASGYHG